jgi:MtrB/PioB family decaheme-associated outer membrane protein
MRNKTQILSSAALTPLAAAIAAVFAAAPVAANPAGVDTSGWKCEQCPFYGEYEAEVEAGAIYIDEDSARFGRYNGLDEKGTYADVSARGGQRRESGTYYDYELIDLGLDTREGRLTVGREGVLEATLHYDEIPYNAWDTTATPYVQTAKDTLSLPAGWVRAGSTAGMSALGSTIRPVTIGTDRSSLGLGLSWLARSNVEVYADARREEIEGNRRSPVVFLGQIAELPEPVDASHDQFEVGAVYRFARGYARLSWYLSKYDNSLDGFLFENAYLSAAPDTVFGRKAQAPDNDANLLAIDGNFLLPWWDGVLSYRLADGRYEQDATLLPISTSAALTGGATLPRADLDGRVDTAHYRANLSLKPHSRVRLRGNYRFDERDDRTDPFTVTYVETDSFPGGTATTQRFGYERTRFEGLAEGRVLDWLFVAVGGSDDEVERSNQETSKTTETSTWGRARLKPHPTVEFAATYGEARIESGEYVTRPDQPPENPLLRKYNLTNRDRDFIEGRVTWSPGKVSFTAEATVSEDTYGKSLIGLQTSDDTRYAGTASWAFHERGSVYVTGGYQEIESLQAGAEGIPPTQDWRTRHEDEFLTVGTGIRFDKVLGKVDLTLDYTFARSEGQIATEAVVGGGPFPQLDTELNSVRIGAGYDVNERLRVNLTYVFEDYDSSDWQLDGVQPTTVRNLLSLGADAYNYRVNGIGLSFQYRFGAAKAPAAEAEEE